MGCGLTLQTLLDIAENLDIALVVGFADFPTFLRTVAETSPDAMAPRPIRMVQRKGLRAVAGRATSMFHRNPTRELSSC
jgi:hypothetical protein